MGYSTLKAALDAVVRTNGRQEITGSNLNGVMTTILKGVDILDRANPADTTGLNKVVLDKSKTFAEQVTETNTIYEIRDVFDLNASSVTIPSGCEFVFSGGVVKNGTLNATRFKSNIYGFEDVTINGFVDFTSPLNVPIDDPKDFLETILAYKEITSVEPTIFVFAAGKTYNWNGVVHINKKNVSLIGGGTIEGTLHLGLTAQDFQDLNYGAYPATSHFNYVISGLRFSKYGVIGSSTDPSTIVNYIKNADASNDDNVAISLINVCHVKISDCFFDNVPYPIVYRPNATYVNQNVRRLNVVNCDFERCHTGILAPSIVKSSIEYGDLLVANCNFYPTHAGIDVECIDGFKLFGNIFNTGSSGVHPFNVKAYLPGQVVISHNSFYGENNDFAVMIDSPSNAEIVGNLFSSQSTSSGVGITTTDMSAALIVKVTAVGAYCAAASIVGNQFLKVEKPIMMRIAGDIRNLNITGNSMTLNEYLDSRRVLYALGEGVTFRANCIQPCYNSASLSSVFNNLIFKQNVIADVLVRGNYTYYPDLVSNHLGNKDYWYGTKRVTIEKFVRYKPIFVIRFVGSVAPQTASNVSFIFNGIKYTISLSSSMSKSDALTSVINAISSDWSDKYNMQIIGNLLWIVGKQNGIECNCPFFVLDNNTSVQVLTCVYQNLGFRAIVRDTDRKGFINADAARLASNYYGIDGGDNGKRLVFNGKSVTLKAVNTPGVVGKLTIRNFISSSENYVLLDNDTFFGFDSGATETGNELVSAIVSLAYSDIYSVSGNLLSLTEEGYECFYVQQGNTPWYWTWSGHCCTYQFVTDDGRIYNPSTDSFNDVGTTANRPSISSVRKGFVYFDETLGKCIVSNGTDWVNMDGTPLA